MPSAEIDDGFPAFDSEGTQGGGASSFVFEPPVVFEATAAPWPARITAPRGISVLKSAGSYRQVRVPTDDEVKAADIAYIGGGVYPLSSAERTALTNAGYGDRIATAPGDGPLLTGIVEVNGIPCYYVDEDGAATGEEAELTIEDGLPVFTTD